MGDDAKRSTAPTVDEKRRGARVVDSRARGSDPQDAAPSQDGQRYTIGEEIARGGMGRVVEATDTVLGRAVALKEALASDAEALRRFKRETRITARLEHPSIVPVHDAGTSPDGSPFYVMRKVSGRPLEKLVVEADTLAKRLTLLPHIVAAAQAMAHAHRRGVVHRDLKPSNILVGDLGETIVIDWGLAKVMDETDEDDPHAPPPIDPGTSLRTRVGVVYGTPGFMPAEQLRSEPVDERSDVYALGATLYFVLARVAPHASPSQDEMMLAAAAGPPTPISELVPGVPPELATIVDKALAFDPHKRYPDAAALAEDLQRFLAGQLVASHRYSRRERFGRFLRKHRVPVTIAAIALFAITIGAVFAIARIVRERDRAEAARQHEEERGDQLLLDRARGLVATDPTTAVALLKQLETPPGRWAKHWQQARAIAAGARVAGVAWGAPTLASRGVVQLSPSGRLAVAIDGKRLRLYDLEHRTYTDLTTAEKHDDAHFADEQHLVLSDNHTIDILDLKTHAEAPIHAPEATTVVEATTKAVLWTDLHHLWFAPLDGSAPPRQIQSIQGVMWVVPSPDGRWLAVAANSSVVVLSADAPWDPPRVLAAEMPKSPLAWTADSSGVVANFGTRIAALPIDGTPPKWHPFDAAFSTVGSSRGELLASGSDGRLVLIGDNATTRTLTDDPIEVAASLRPTYDDRIAFVHGAKVSVLRGTQSFDLLPPADRIIWIAARRGSPFLVAVGIGRLYVYDLRAIAPAPIAKLPRSIFTTFVGRHDLLVATLQDAWQWFDVDRLTVAATFDGLPPLLEVGARYDEEFVVARDVNTPPARVYLLRKSGGAADVIAHDASIALAEHTGKVLLATSDGSIVEYDPATKARTTLISHAGEVNCLSYAGLWIVAVYDDGHVVWHDRGTGRQSELVLPAGDLKRDNFAYLQTDGTACLPRGHKLACFTPAGKLVNELDLPDDIVSMTEVSDGVLLLGLPDGSRFLVDPITGAKHGTMIAGTMNVSTASREPLGIYLSGRRTIEMVDFATSEHWPVSRDTEHWVSAGLSADGRFVLAMEPDGSTPLWQIELPTTADDTAKWLDAQTNATTEVGTTALTWH